MHRLLILIALLAGPVGAARAAEAVVQGMRLDLPEGWQRTDLDDGTILRRDVDGAGRALILISAARPATQPFDQAFAAFAATPEQMARERPLSHGRGVSLNDHPMRYEQRCCRAPAAATGGTRVSMNVFHVGIAAPAGHRFLSLTMIRMEREAENAVRDEFAALVRSVRPEAGDRAYPLTPLPGGGGLEGLYTRMQTGVMPNAFGGMDMTTDMKVMLFTPDGLFARELPPDADVPTFCRTTPGECGTYVLRPGGDKDGGGLELNDVENRFGMLSRRIVPIAQEGARLRLDRETWNRIEPLPADHRLAGTWRYFHASSGSTAFSSGSIAVEQLLTLTADGRFTRTGWSGFNSSVETGNTRTSVVTNNPRPASEGTYRIDGYRLTLTGSDGVVETRSLYTADRGSDGMLVIGGRNWLRRESPPGTPAAPRPGTGYGGAPKQ